ncbi:MAG TPA: hypothetical protein VFI95_04835, partial [Terriglobales bacterium]|nr:hypothetical protein [Terriglobales bacterium]
MRILLCILLISSFSWAQEAKPAPPSAEETSAKSATLTIPAGTRVPVSLRQPISTKTAREGDAVYANTSFPFVLNERVLVPAGTYVQGRISSVKRGGRIHG